MLACFISCPAPANDRSEFGAGGVAADKQVRRRSVLISIQAQS
jgi:hypothetical protein